MSPSDSDWGLGDVRGRDPLVGSSPSGMSETLYGLVRNFFQSQEAASLLRRTFGLVPQNPGDIKATGATRAPAGWLLCDGASYAISSYPKLYAAIGKAYGGDGVANFKVPNLVGKTAIGPNTNYVLGSSGGEEFHTILLAELPAHAHTVRLKNDGGVTAGNLQIGAAGNTFGFDPTGTVGGSGTDSGLTGSVGTGSPSYNMPPFTVLNFCIFTGI